MSTARRKLAEVPPFVGYVLEGTQTVFLPIRRRWKRLRNRRLTPVTRNVPGWDSLRACLVGSTIHQQEGMNMTSSKKSARTAESLGLRQLTTIAHGHS
jgi:hypothetical protein